MKESNDKQAFLYTMPRDRITTTTTLETNQALKPKFNNQENKICNNI